MDFIKCVAVGDGAVGKSAALISYTSNRFPDEYQPTVFENYCANLMVDGRIISLNLWDTAGQEDYDRLRPLSYPQTEVFILMYNSISTVSFANVKSRWYPEIRYYCPETPIVLVATKTDLRDNAEYVAGLNNQGLQVVSTEDGMSMAKDLGCDFFEISALTQMGLKDAFDGAVKAALKYKHPQKPATCGCTVC